MKVLRTQKVSRESCHNECTLHGLMLRYTYVHSSTLVLDNQNQNQNQDKTNLVHNPCLVPGTCQDVRKTRNKEQELKLEVEVIYNRVPAELN
jgi:hypothetical protein